MTFSHQKDSINVLIVLSSNYKKKHLRKYIKKSSQQKYGKMQRQTLKIMFLYQYNRHWQKY